MMVLTLLPTNLVFADSVYSGGDGTKTTPYLISTLDDLETLSNKAKYRTLADQYFKLTADIDMSFEYGADIGGTAKSWSPIGQETMQGFNGTFDGNGHKITGLYINSTEKNQGLFGKIGSSAKISNLGVSGSVTGGEQTGGIVGDSAGTIENCYNECTVSGTEKVGGVAGWPSGNTEEIKNCYNTGAVSGDKSVGGVAGQCGTMINNCYNTGTVSGKENVGGVIGMLYAAWNDVTAKNCYSTGTITGTITGTTSVGGVVGMVDGETVADCYYSDSCVSGGNAYGTSVTADGLKSESTFSNWDFTSVWIMDTDRPLLRSCLEKRGTAVAPYTISNLAELKAFRDAVNGTAYGNGKTYEDKYIKLTADIDLESSASDLWESIGKTYGANKENNFMGTFDGDGHAITNLYSEKGLFGSVQSATIKNLSVSGKVQNGNAAGGIAGDAVLSTIENCVSHVDISGESNLGGIVGHASGGGIRNCANTGEISTSTGIVGGIVGRITSYYSSEPVVENCYNTGDIEVAGGEAKQIGGLAGLMEVSALKNCYNYGKVNGSKAEADVGGAVGKKGGTQCKIDTATVFYLEGCVTTADNVTATTEGTVKTAAAFASGEVAYALQGTRTTQVWGQEIGKDNTPILTSDADKAVHKITFATSTNDSYDVRYVNHGKTLAKEDFPTAPTATTDGKTFHHWSQTNEADGDVFDETTTVDTDITVYAVGMEKTGAATDDDVPSDTIKGGKGTTTIDIDLNKLVTGGEGAEWNFTFKLVEGTLPVGVTFDAETGVISGTATKAKYGKVVFDVTNDQIALMSLDDTGTKLTLTFDISFNGSGMEAEPYLIEELEDLEYLRDKVNDYNDFAGKYIKIKDDTDIDMSSKYSETTGVSWTPIGTGESKSSYSSTTYKAFNGTFDGNSRTIENLYVKGTESDGVKHYGLFGSVRDKGEIKDLTVTGSVTGVDTRSFCGVGGIVGLTRGMNADNRVKITNCTNKATVQTGNAVGGVAGDNENCEIKDCENIGTVKNVIEKKDAKCQYVGGIVGKIGTNGTLTGCVNTADGLVEGGNNYASGNDDVSVGGIAGFANASVKNCNNNGIVKSDSTINYNGLEYLGGIVGYAAENGAVTQCTNTGTVSYILSDGASGEPVGGIVGYATGKIEECTNSCTFEITGTNIRGTIGAIAGKVGTNGVVSKCVNETALNFTNFKGLLGGIAGENFGMVKNCTNTVAVTSGAGWFSKTGGIVGNNTFSGSSGGVIENCGNEAKISGGCYVGGIAGYNNKGTVSKSWNTAEIAQQGWEDDYDRDIGIGGVVGINAEGTVENCYSAAEKLKINAMIVSESGYGGLKYTYYIGGVVGWNYGTVNNCWSNTMTLGNAVTQPTDVTGVYNYGSVVGGNKRVDGTGSSATTKQGTVTDCYYQAGTFSYPTDVTEVGPSGESAENYDVESRTADQFANGDLTWELQNNPVNVDATQIWGQNITVDTKDAHPVLTDAPAKQVCKVTFWQKGAAAETYDAVVEAQYTNKDKCVTLPTTDPTAANYTFSHWTTATALGSDNDDDYIFTAETPVTARDTRVYAVGKEQTESVSTAEPSVKVQKGATYTAENSPIDLKDLVQNKSGNSVKNFSFGAVDESKLPNGLAVTTDGKITGAATKAGFYTVTIGAENHGLALMSTEGASSTDESFTFDLTIEVTLAKDESGAYIISDLDELEYFRDSVNKGTNYKNETVKLTADIDMSEKYLDVSNNWTPIGETANAFNGTFDGNGKTIKGLYAYYKSSYNGTKDNVGLFGFVETNGSIKNLSVTDSKVGGKKNVGGIVGTCKGAIMDCSNSGSVEGNENVGGIVGCFTATSDNKKTIENCCNKATVHVSLVSTASAFANGSDGGGIVGKGQNVIVRNCSNSGKVSGGVATSASTSKTISYYSENIGGIAGLGDNLTVENCYNGGEIEAAANVGGLVGKLTDGDVRICYNNGAVSLYYPTYSPADRYVGALVGTADENTDVQKCYYLKADELKAVGNKENNVAGTVLGEVTEDDFAGGVVAAVLEEYASEGAAEGYTLTWGQKLGGTDADSAPVLTRDTTAKVYPITLMVNVPWSDSAADREYKKWKDAYGNIGRETELPNSITIAAFDKPGRFRDWSKTANGEALAMKYTPTGASDTVYSLWNTVTFDVSSTEKTYTQGVEQNISFTPYLNGTASSDIADKFQVKYYKFDENEDKLESTTPVKKAQAQGTYLYVISAKDTAADNQYYIDGEYKVKDGVLTLPSDWETTCKNIGIMTITAGTQAQQEPIFFADGAVSMYVSDEPITNALTNGNGTTPTVTSSNEDVATVTFAGGVATVTAVGKGTATIKAKSEKEGTSPVYASFTVTVTKEVITVTANDKTITYGDVFVNDGYKVSKEGVTLNETDIEYTTDYNKGDGIGKYEIEVSGLTSDLYDIEYKSGKLKVEPKTLGEYDFDVSAEGKEYDGTDAATVTAKVKPALLGASDDVVNVLVSGTFNNKNAGTNKTVTYEITGLSGRDSSNYKMEAETLYGEKTAYIEKAKVKVNAPKTTTYVYDGDAKSVNVTATANNGIYFDSFGVTYQPIDESGADSDTAVAEPKDRGTYKVVVTLNSDIAGNYKIENESEFDAKLTIKSAQQDFFSIEGISDTVTYGDPSITLQAAGAIEGGNVTWEVLDGTEYAEVNETSGEVTIKGAGTVKVKATSKKDNYNDKTATRTFVIQPKTLTVTASASEKEYDGEKDVKGNVNLTLNGVVVGDDVSIDNSGVTATVATADVENGKTVFVNGLALNGTKSTNYKLAATSMQTSIDITKKEITKVSMTAAGKTYDGTTDATYTITNLEGVIEADKNFVTVTGTAAFDGADEGSGKTVTLSGLALSGTKSGNYKLNAIDATATANIEKATVNFSFGTLSYVYDGKEKEAPITATVNGKPFTKYSVFYGSEDAAKVINVGTHSIKIVVSDSNYQSDYDGKQTLTIVAADQSAMTITGLPGTVAYGSEFVLYAVGGNNTIPTTWSVTKGDDIATIDEEGKVTVNGADKEVTVTATKTDTEHNYNEQTTSITFKPTKKAATFKITDLSQTYDGSKKNATITATADVASGVTGISASDYTVTYTNENGTEVAAENLKNAGTYYVDVKANAGSMFTGEQNAVLTVKKGKLDTTDITITAKNAELAKDTITYGDTYTVTHNYSGAAADATLTYTGTGLAGESKTQPTKAGTYTAILTIANPNYENVTVSKEFTIAKKTLTATADDQTREYGQNNEPLTVTLTEFVAGEDKKQVLIMPIASTAATSSSDVDTYDITVSGGYAENYDFNYVSGKLTVTAATKGYIEIRNGKSNPYVGDSFKPEAWFNGQKIDVTWSMSTDGIVTIADDGTMNVVGVGRVILTATATSANCKGMTTTFTVDAQKKQITLDQFGTTVQTTYTGAAQKIAFTAGSVDLTDVTIKTTYMMMGDTSKTTPVDVGTYMVMYNIVDDLYEGSGTCYLTINKANVAVKAKDVNKTYGDEFTDYELDWNGGDPLDDSVKDSVLAEIKQYVTFTSTGAPEAAEVLEGGYAIDVTASQTEMANVKFTVTGGTLTVDPASLIITVSNVTRAFGEENPTPEVTYNDFVTIGGVKETTDVLEGELTFTYADGETPINAETAVGTYTDGVKASGVTAKNYEITFEDGDVIINPIAVKATAGASRATYLTIRFDKALAGLTDANFTVANGEEPVTVTEVSASSDNKTYTLKGTFAVGTAYTVTIDLTGTAYEETHAISGSPLTITPSNPSSGGGGGGSASSTYTVKFETNGGSAIDSVKVKKNETVTAPAAPTKEGFEFAGWYADKKLTTKYDFAAKVTKAMTLYAAWTEKEVEPEPTPSVPTWTNPFTDVKESDWFYESVKYVNENGMMSGMTETLFAPDAALTRGMLVTVLYRAEGEPAVNRSIPFADVKADSYYADAVNWAQQNGIVSGVSEEEFAPDENITREQIATIMFRYAKYQGVAPEGAWAIRMDYADVADIADYATEGVMYCTLKGIMQGKDNHMFAPKENATRAEIAAILGRYIAANQ